MIRAALWCLAGVALFGALQATPEARPPAVAPEFSAQSADNWLNSPPLKLSNLRGGPVLIEFWTFGCSNCRNTLPWLKQIHERYGKDGLTIVGVHTPEFRWERENAAVARAIKELGVKYPVMLDPEFAYWNALNNQYWPAFYLVDASGAIVDSRIGELHAGTARADKFEAAIAAAIERAVR